MKLWEIAHSRTGDKGNISDISLIAYDQKDYELIREKVTADRVKKWFSGMVKGCLLCDLPDGQLLPEMFLDILDRLMNACYPIHWSHRPSVLQHTGNGRSLPDFPCSCLSGDVYAAWPLGPPF